MPPRRRRRDLHAESDPVPPGRPQRRVPAAVTGPGRIPVLDVVYVLATVALCALVGLIGKGVERL